MMKYMLTFSNSFNGGCEYFKTHTEAVRRAMQAHKFGFIPESVYKYNPTTDKYDIPVGRFTVTTKEV